MYSIGDWVYVKDFDKNFKILGILEDYPTLLQITEDVWISPTGCTQVETEKCHRCDEQKPDARQMRYSYSAYAGRMCDDCAYDGYRDHCGLEGPQGDPQDLDEDLEPEEYCGMTDWGY